MQRDAVGTQEGRREKGKTSLSFLFRTGRLELETCGCRRAYIKTMLIIIT